MVFKPIGEMLEVDVKDSTGMRIEKRKINLNDRKAATKLIKWLSEKYGFEFDYPFKKDEGAAWLDPDSSFLDIT